MAIWTIHDELNALINRKPEPNVTFKRQVHDMVLFGYLRSAVEKYVWPEKMRFENAPFFKINLRGRMRVRGYATHHQSWVANDVMAITLEKGIIQCDMRSVPIWKYREAFVHVHNPRDWELLSCSVTDQLVREEFEEFTSKEDELQSRAAYYAKYGELL